MSSTVRKQRNDGCARTLDQWDFKKWRKKLAINQVAAGEMLRLSRGAVQYWESELRPIPLAVELACQESLRRWKPRPEFGPVTRLYADGPISGLSPMGVGLAWLLVIIVLILAAAALVKYLRSGDKADPQ